MVQIRRRQPNPAVEVLCLRYQVAIPGAETSEYFRGNCLA